MWSRITAVRRRFVQDRETGKLREVTAPTCRPRPAGPAVRGDIEAFKSPIDGSEITGRRALREHQERHDVRLHGEYGENNGQEYFARRAREREAERTGSTPTQRRERIEALRRAIDTHRST
jgi:hypothetical protein